MFSAIGARVPFTERLALSGARVLDFSIEASSDILKVVFRGDLDISRYAEVCEELSLAERDTRNVLLVFDETVQYIDSFSLSEVLLFQRRLSRAGRLVALHVIRGQVYGMLAASGVVRRLNAYLNGEQALETLRTSAPVT